MGNHNFSHLELTVCLIYFSHLMSKRNPHLGSALVLHAKGSTVQSKTLNIHEQKCTGVCLYKGAPLCDVFLKELMEYHRGIRTHFHPPELSKFNTGKLAHMTLCIYKRSFRMTVY